MVQIQEASRADLMVRLITAAGADHGPAVLVIESSLESRVLIDAIVRYALPIGLVALDADAEALAVGALGVGRSRVRRAATLEAALFGQRAWITAARGDSVKAYEYDERHGLLRFNPLAEWTNADLLAYADANGIARHTPRAAAAARELLAA